MGKVIAVQSMSLDGFTTGPNVTFDVPMGVRGEELHDWMFSNDAGAEAATRRSRHREQS